MKRIFAFQDVGITEKGFLTLELQVETNGGHSSTPPKETSIGIMSRALNQLEKNPMAAHLDIFEETIKRVTHEFPIVQRFILSNLWLFGPLVKLVLAQEPAVNAQLRTTTALTYFKR